MLLLPKSDRKKISPSILSGPQVPIGLSHEKLNAARRGGRSGHRERRLCIDLDVGMGKCDSQAGVLIMDELLCNPRGVGAGLRRSGGAK